MALCHSIVLRFWRLQFDCDWFCQSDGLHTHDEFPKTLPRAKCWRCVAALAYLTHYLVPRLCVQSARWISQRKVARHLQPWCTHVSCGLVARCQLDLCLV